jgi:hypothetical protein
MRLLANLAARRQIRGYVFLLQSGGGASALAALAVLAVPASPACSEPEHVGALLAVTTATQ